MSTLQSKTKNLYIPVGPVGIGKDGMTIKPEWNIHRDAQLAELVKRGATKVDDETVWVPPGHIVVIKAYKIRQKRPSTVQVEFNRKLDPIMGGRFKYRRSGYQSYERWAAMQFWLELKTIEGMEFLDLP